MAVDTAYGTDPRHALIATAVADKVVFKKPISWSLGRQFGRAIDQRTMLQRLRDINEDRKRRFDGG